jgi:hypothetical protein
MKKANPLTGAKEQNRCKGCNSLHSRVTRVTKTSQFLKDGYQELTPETRVTFMKESGALFGGGLRKALCESITKSKTSKQIFQFKTEGEFKEVDEVKADFTKKGKNDQLANLLDNGTSMTCPHTKADLIWVPKHTMAVINEETESEERKRKVEGQGNIKNPKKIKGEPKIPKADGKEQPVLPVSDAHMKRLEKALPLIQDQIMQVNGVIVEADCEEMREFVSQRIVAKAKSIVVVAETVASEVEAMITKKEAVKGDVPALFTRMKESQETSNNLKVQLTGMLDFAKMGQ